MTERVDAVVIGGGPVGAAAALEMSAAGLAVLLIEARETLAAPGDLRPLALSYGSRLILERLGVWPALQAATPIERIHVSQRGRFGRTVLTAAEAKLPALGYVLDYASVLSAMDEAVEQARLHRSLRILRGARVTAIAHDRTSARIAFQSAAGAAECHASVVAVADGSAEAVDVPVRVVEYGQSAVSARVETDRSHAHTAYERFTPEGPLALLPYGTGYAIVWTTTAERAQWLCDAASREFLAALQERFGERTGRFTAVSARAAHRLVLRIAEDTACGRAALIGNSAQALHPVAGQGFNLGLRDAWELAGEIRKRGADDEGLLQAYRARRRFDRGGGVTFTHALVKIFSNDSLPLALARGAGLTLLDCIPPAKNFFARRMIFGARG